jgi:hypothetical protein
MKVLAGLVPMLLWMLTVQVMSTLRGTHSCTRSRKLFEWGTTFAGLAPTYNVKIDDCSYDGRPVCCSLLGNSSTVEAETGPTVVVPAAACSIKRVYVPSVYEVFNFEMAKNLSELASEDDRRNLFIKYLRNEVEASNTWLARVHAHMQSADLPEGNEDDMKYLSRFQVTRTCNGEAMARLSSTWIEWIEPLTIHARHPFALKACNHWTHVGEVYTAADLEKMKFQAGIQSLDYILVQSGTSLHEETQLRQHNHSRFEAHHNRQHRASHMLTHNYMFDAGTSTFESSLRWFLCAYMQVIADCKGLSAARFVTLPARCVSVA